MTKEEQLRENLQDWRAEQGIRSAKAAAELLGVPENTYSMWERGKSWPQGANLGLLRKAGVDVPDEDGSIDRESDEYDAIAIAVVSLMTGIPKDDLAANPALGLLDAAHEAAVEAKKAEIGEKAKRRKAELQPSPESRRPSPAEKRGRGNTR